MIRVLIADDHVVLREGVAALVRAQADMQVVGETGDAESTVARCLEVVPDVAIIDLGMPGGGVSAIERIARAAVGVRSIALTMHDDPSYMWAVMTAGGSGYVLKGAAGAELLEAVRSVAQGQSYIRAPLGATGFRELPNRGASALRALSLREREVLERVARGFTNREIAEELGLSTKTVDTYRARLQDKLGVTSRAELVAYALRAGVLVPKIDLPD